MRTRVMLLLCLALASGVISQTLTETADGSVNVPISDSIYRDIDLLIASQLIEDAIYGQRPWSRGEIARMIREAMQHKPHNPNDALSLTILNRLQREFAEELHAPESAFHPFESVQTNYTYLRSPDRSLPIDNGTGSVDGVLNPLISNREGREFVNGGTWRIESTHRWSLSKDLAFYFKPLLEVFKPTDGSAKLNLLVQQLYLKLTLGNLEIEAGRDSLLYGQGEFGGLMLSNNARPLDMVKLTNAEPFLLPWFLEGLGPTRIAFFVSYLGQQRVLPNSLLIGIRGSIKPSPLWELGGGETLVSYGTDSQNKTFDFVPELLVFRRESGDTTITKSDHRFSFDIRRQMPALRNSQLYFESLLDYLSPDSLRADLTWRMGYQVGLYMPFLTEDGSNSLRLEFTSISPILYRHTRWTTGYTLEQQLLGNEIGPDSRQVRITYQRDILDGSFWVSRLAYDRINGETYQSPSNTEIEPITRIPIESRIRMDNQIIFNHHDKLQYGINFGVERVLNFNFEAGSRLWNWLGSVSINYLPGWSL